MAFSNNNKNNRRNRAGNKTHSMASSKSSNSKSPRKAILDSKGKIDKDSKTHIKAYKLLSLQHNISTNKAKQLIDSGLVQIDGKRLEIARTMLPCEARLSVIEIKQDIIYEDKDLLVLDKSVGVECYGLEKQYVPYKLINRLDRDTSGVILMAKNEKTRTKAISEFKDRKVEKIYFALVDGQISEDMEIKTNIATTTKDSSKISKVSKHGEEAITLIKPSALIGKKTLLEIQIITGKTHQIRTHLASIKHPIIGDVIYNKTQSRNAKRLMLHCHKTTLFDKEFISKVDIYKTFDISRD